MSGAVKLCKRGHERTPENLYKNGACKACWLELYYCGREKGPKKYCINGHERDKEGLTSSGGCKACAKAQQKEFSQSPKRKAYNKIYSKSSAFKASQSTYKASPKGAAAEQSLNRKEHKKAHFKSPEYKAVLREYRKSPKYQEAQKKVRDQLPDSYVAGRLGFKVGEVERELVELKRNQILLTRELKSIKKEQENNNAVTLNA